MALTELIGIGGYKGVGKNTAASILTDKYGFKEISFAAPLKKICSEFTGLPYSVFESQETKDQPFKKGPFVLTLSDIHDITTLTSVYGAIKPEQKDLILADGFRKTLTTPRQMLQFVGTDLIRKNVDYTFWCKAYEKEISKHSKVVSPDVRFENERKTVRDLGGKMVLVKRPQARTEDTHASENDYGLEIEYSHTFFNNKSILDLRNNVEEWYVKIKPLLILGF